MAFLLVTAVHVYAKLLSNRVSSIICWLDWAGLRSCICSILPKLNVEQTFSAKKWIRTWQKQREQTGRQCQRSWRTCCGNNTVTICRTQDLNSVWGNKGGWSLYTNENLVSKMHLIQMIYSFVISLLPYWSLCCRKPVELTRLCRVLWTDQYSSL